MVNLDDLTRVETPNWAFAPPSTRAQAAGAQAAAAQERLARGPAAQLITNQLVSLRTVQDHRPEFFM